MPAQVIVFTDLDGTLLDFQTYSFENASTGINLLKKYSIPLIPVTSKTRTEVMFLLQNLDLNGPAIVENGCAIVFMNKKVPSYPEVEYFEDGIPFIRIAGNHHDTVRFLKKLSKLTGIKLTGFNDLTPQEVAKLSGLTIELAERAMKREFCEPFIKPHDNKLEHIRRIANLYGYKILLGDRFCHLVKAEADKGKAIQKYLKIYKHDHGGDVISIGLGNSPNDIDMLEVVDIPIVVPNLSGAHPELLRKNWRVAPFPGPKGWAYAIRETLRELGVLKV